MEKLTDEHKEIIRNFIWCEDYCGGRYDSLKKETGYSLKKLKKLMAELRDMGVVFHSVCANPDDGSPAGSANFLCEDYEYLMDEL